MYNNIYMASLITAYPIKVSDSTNSTSNTTGAITVTGGIGVSGNIQSNGYLGVGGAIGDATYPLNVAGAAKISSYLGINGAIGSASFPLNVTGDINCTSLIAGAKSFTSTKMSRLGVNGALASDPGVGLDVVGNLRTAGGGIRINGGVPPTAATVCSVGGRVFLSGSIGYSSTGAYSTSFGMYDPRGQTHYYGGLLQGNAFNISSDIRCKTNISEINTKEAFDIIKSIEPKTYNLIDNDSDKHYGFIAQEVFEILPDAVIKNMGMIPNIYDTADVTSDTEPGKLILTLRTKTLPEYDMTVINKLQLKINGMATQAVIQEILSPNSFSILKPHIFKHDMTEIFVFGTEIQDFHHIDYDYIYSINVAAFKEFDKMIQEETQRDVLLLQRVSALEAN